MKPRVRHEELRDVSTHFRFGENWREYARHIDSERIAQAQSELVRLLGLNDLGEKRFLDIGSGSGLHSLAASRLGCAHVLATDIDADSVETTRAVLAAHATSRTWECLQVSILEMTPEEFGRFDVVYSWGVLHHTGAMWEAIRRAAALVSDEGLLAIALYLKTPFCGFWRAEKRIYSRSPRLLQIATRVLYVATASLREVLGGRNPFASIAMRRDGERSRGMRYWNNVHDWLGGYPYESAAPSVVESFVSNLGFDRIRALDTTPSLGMFGSGCAQYLFRKGTPSRSSEMRLSQPVDRWPVNLRSGCAGAEDRPAAPRPSDRASFD